MFSPGQSRASVLQAAAMAAKWWEPPRDALDTMVLGAADLDALTGLRHVDFTSFDPTLKARQSSVSLMQGAGSCRPGCPDRAALCRLYAVRSHAEGAPGFRTPIVLGVDLDAQSMLRHVDFTPFNLTLKASLSMGHTCTSMDLDALSGLHRVQFTVFDPTLKAPPRLERTACCEQQGAGCCECACTSWVAPPPV